MRFNMDLILNRRVLEALIIVTLYSSSIYMTSSVLCLEDYSNLYSYDKSIPLNPVEELVREEDKYVVYRVYFDSVNGERVPALLILPKTKDKIPCIVSLHGYGGRKEDILPLTDLAVSEEYALIAIDAEYHGERKEEGKALYSADIEGSVKGIIQTVIDLRRAVDYIETRPEIDSNRIGYVGGSMGGILGAIFIGVEPRIKAAALLVAGGNMSLMIRESQHPAIPPIREYLKLNNISYEELQRLLNPIDPINFIGNFSPRPVVFHLGKYDRIVPAEAGEQLYKYAGEPKTIYWYDSGHDLPLELVVVRILDFMDMNLKNRRMMFYETREFKYWFSRYIVPSVMVTAIILLLIYVFRRKIVGARLLYYYT
ncbi:acetylxylan esterase [Candidatus Bathyarchaeota archaeon]|nr:acetylxylan esterase [Candidatus Bathyarchaeota archaeon]